MKIIRNEDIAFGPIVWPGHGSNCYRVVLRVDRYEDGTIAKIYVHNQVMLKADEKVCPGSKTVISYSDGNYYEVFGGDVEAAYKKASEKWIERCQKSLKWPLASEGDVILFMIKAAEKRMRDTN